MTITLSAQAMPALTAASHQYLTPHRFRRDPLSPFAGIYQRPTHPGSEDV